MESTLRVEYRELIRQWAHSLEEDLFPNWDSNDEPLTEVQRQAIRACLGRLIDHLSSFSGVEAAPHVETKEAISRATLQPQPSSSTADPRGDHLGDSEKEMTPMQESCGFALYGPPALCTCGTCKPEGPAE